MTRYPELPHDDLGVNDLASFHALRRWRLVLAGCAGLLALSLLAWFSITRREEPKVDMPFLSVSLLYPGASPEDVETQVVKPLEEDLYGMERMKVVDSTAMPNMASFQLEFEEGVDIDVMAEKVRGKIQGRMEDLPAAVENPEVQIESTTLTPQMLVAVMGYASDPTLTAEAKRLKADLLTVPGVSGIDLTGDQKPAVRVRLDPVRLASHELSAEQIALALQSANARVPGGEYRLNGISTLLQVNQSFQDAASVQQVPVVSSSDTQGGSRTVLLGDIADVTDSTLAPKTHFLVQGRPAVGMAIRFRADADAVTVGKGVRQRLKGLEATVPKGLSLAIVHDQPRLITKSVNSFVSSLLEGVLLVLGVVTLGMGWRPALVVSGVIPLAVGGAVLGLQLLGFSLEMISLAGLTMALGLLVDDAVAVTESIHLMRDKGLSPVRAAVLGTARVFRANNGTTLVAIVSFLPLFFMGGDIGQFIRGLPAAVMIALATSLLVAQLVTPWLSTLLLRMDVVVVYKVDRLSRSLPDFAQVMEHFNTHSVGFVSVTQHFSTTDPVGRLTMNMLMSFAEFEREMIAGRIRDKIRATRRKGQWTGGVVPLGYRSEKSHLLVHEEEAPWVKHVFQWYVEGLSALTIARRLNEAQVPLKTAKEVRPNPWTKPLVLRILRNRLYLGELSCQGEFVLAEHPALIDLETFEKVQRMLEPKDRRQRHEARNPVYLVRGALKCGICGGSMTSASTFREGRLYRYYRCSTRDKKGKEGCPTVQLGAEAIERFVVERLQKVLADPACTLPLQRCLQPLGLLAAGGNLTELWAFLSLANRQRLVRLLVKEVVVDQRVGKLSVTLRNPADLEEVAC